MAPIVFCPATDAAALDINASRSGVELLSVGDKVEYRQFPEAIKSSIVRALGRSGEFHRTYEIKEAIDHDRLHPHYVVTRLR